MDGPTRRPGGGRRAAPRFLAVVLLALPALTGCGPRPADGLRADTEAVRRLLDGWAAALRDRDEHAYLAAVDPSEPAYRDRRRRVFANLAEVPLASWEYGAVRTGGFTPAPGEGGGHRVAAEAELRYRLAGYDAAPITVPVRLTAVRRAGRWYVAGDDTASGTRQLWEQGRVTAVRGRHSLVLGAGQDTAALRALSGLAEAAVPAVTAAWRDDDRPDRPDKSDRLDRLVVEMPASLERMGGLLGAPPSDYRGIAAVTTTAEGGNGPGRGGDDGPAGRIVVNPEAYTALSPFGRRAVLTHEATHVATRARTTDATPMWLSEGFADWVAYRTADRAPAAIAPELARSLADGLRPPVVSPSDGQTANAPPSVEEVPRT
ncbi:hypothetical protein ACSNOK_12625, partial [Streptomyces sp. URMC 126]|uniref:hypothetical protein n=1 Tax=Streptomyces sp. URMC 126 TaxID=3423401 RepID=UPI003F1BD874